MVYAPHPPISAGVCFLIFFFFFNDTATTEIYTLSLHDALPIFSNPRRRWTKIAASPPNPNLSRSEEHTSELQSLTNLVCRLLLEKKKKNNNTDPSEQITALPHSLSSSVTGSLSWWCGGSSAPWVRTLRLRLDLLLFFFF